jgi:hypothetical protein
VAGRALELTLGSVGYDVRFLHRPLAHEPAELLGGTKLVLLEPRSSAEEREAFVRYMGFREHPSLLKNSFVPYSARCSGAKSPIFGRFKLGSGPQIGPAATFSTGSPLLGSSVNWGTSCTLFGSLADLPDQLLGLVYY